MQAESHLSFFEHPTRQRDPTVLENAYSHDVVTQQITEENFSQKQNSESNPTNREQQYGTYISQNLVNFAQIDLGIDRDAPTENGDQSSPCHDPKTRRKSKLTAFTILKNLTNQKNESTQMNNSTRK